MANSHAMNVRTPDVLVQLRLETGRDAVGEHPLGERFHLHFSPDGREKQRPTIELPLLDDGSRPLVVGAVSDDELDLALRTEVLEIRPTVLFDLARAGAFHVEDHRRPRINGCDVD